MNNVREVNRINDKELELAVEGGASWHDDYKDSAYIFVGGLDKRLTEGDVISIFSQYGEILDINLPRIPEGGLRDRNSDNPPSGSRDERDKQQQQQQQAGGKPGDRRGFGFLLYEDQRSTVLAVDNLNGYNLLGRTIRVDHVKDYKMPGAKRREEEGERIEPSRNAAPAITDASQGERDGNDSEDVQDIDLADPMAAYIAAARRDNGKNRAEKEERRRRKEERRLKREAKERRRGDHNVDAMRPDAADKPGFRERDSSGEYHSSSRIEEGRRRHSHSYDDYEDKRRHHRRDYDAYSNEHGEGVHGGRGDYISSRYSRDRGERHDNSRDDYHRREQEYGSRR